MIRLLRWSLLCSFLLVPGMVSAATIALTANNLGLVGTFGIVQYDLLTPTTASVTFTATPSGGTGTLFGGQGAVALNLQSAATVSDLMGTNVLPGFTSGPLTLAGAGNEDGFGSFNLTIDSFDGYVHSSQQISFTLTKSTGTWTNVNQILAVNAIGGYQAAAHIFRCESFPCDVNESAILTGYAVGNPGTQPPSDDDDGGGNPTVTPEPASLVMLGTGLMVMGWIGRKRLRRTL